MKFRIAALAVLCLSSACQTFSQVKEETPSVGVFYFGGWQEGARGLKFSPPWQPIKKYPEREPLLGWYQDGDFDVVDKQFGWMLKYGIDYAVFDWYWDGKNTYLDQSLKQYLKIAESKKIPFSIMWANHDAEPKTKESFDSMVKFWLDSYFSRPEYLLLKKRPIVYLFSVTALERKAKTFGMSGAELIASAQEIAKSHGFDGIDFFGGVDADVPGLGNSAATGYAGYFAYNYHKAPKGGNLNRFSHNFDELRQAYQSQWQGVLNVADAPYILPVTAGWDKRPWGGTASDPSHDNSVSTPQTFLAHLQDASVALKANKRGTLNSMIVCCWNEYGEGSIVEPSKKFGFSYLDQILKVSPGFQKLDR